MTKKINKQKRIVLTGGPGVGKSSIIHFLKEIGFSVREEVFTKIFEMANNEGNLNEEFLHSQELIQELISAQIHLEDQDEMKEFVFLDRSCIDIWGFARNMGIVLKNKDKMTLEGRHYDLVFLVEPMPQEFYVQNGIRRQTFEESLVHHQANLENAVDFLKLQERDLSTTLIRVPFFHNNRPLSVKERSQVILDQLQRFGVDNPKKNWKE